MDGIVGESVKFMILGMGIVYILLMVIVLLTNIQAKIVAKYFPDKPKEADTPKSSGTTSSSDDGAVIAAIVAAVQKYKNS